MNKLLVASLLACAGILPATAHTTEAGQTTQPAAGTSEPVAAGALAEGEIRKVDLEARKLTLRHGEIRNLDMPAMTMVFQVKDPALLSTLKAGDKVRFRAEKSNAALVVTDIQPAK